jgi:branched-chain amino acid transport system substrate-binding protein
MRWVGLSPRSFGVPAAALAALALAGCSTAPSNNTAVIVKGDALTVYATQPPGTDTAVDSDVLHAEKLALQQAGSKSGKFTLRLKVLHGGTVTDDARTAIADNTAIAYLGEIPPGTTGGSVQITNQVGLLQISPTDTAVYLTQPTAAVPGSPVHWYPDHKNFDLTFSRVVPNTSKEARAIVGEMKTLQLTKLHVSSDSSSYGKSVALEIRQDASSAGLSVVSSAVGADAVFYAGVPDPAATKTLDAAAAASPTAKLFVPSAFYDDAWVGGLSAAAQKQLYVSSPGFMPGSYQGTGAAFVSAFQQAYGHRPQPQAVFGYAAVQALLAGLKQAGTNADSRADVTTAVLGLKNQSSALGTYSLDGGDTNIAPFIFARPVAGKLVPRGTG